MASAVMYCEIYWVPHKSGRQINSNIPPLVSLCFFPVVFLSSRVTGACPVTTDLIMLM